MGSAESHQTSQSQQSAAQTDLSSISANNRVMIKGISKKLDLQEQETLNIKNFLESKGYSFTNRLLGKTSQTKILRATDQQGKKVAIKMLECHSMKDYEQNTNEFKVMKLFNSEHIIKVHELFEYRLDNRVLHFLIMERCLSDLQSQMVMAAQMSHPDIYKISLDLVKGLKDVHAKNAVHLDIKPHNVVLGADNKWKFIDMGISNQLNSDGYLEKIQGLTKSYCSPEQYQQFYKLSKARATKSSDIYSLGLVFLRLTGREIPAEDYEISKQSNYNYMVYTNPQFFEFNKLINQMLSYLPEQRPSLSEIEQALIKIDVNLKNNNNLLNPLKNHRKSHHNSISSTPLKQTQQQYKPQQQQEEEEVSSFFVYNQSSVKKPKRELTTPPQNKSMNNIEVFQSPSRSQSKPPMHKINQNDSIIQSNSLNYLKPKSQQKLTLPKINQRQSMINIFQAVDVRQ